MSRHVWRRGGAAAIVALALACAPSAERGDEAPAPPAAERAAPTIELLSPAKDSTGGVPERFEWTSVDGADRYAIGLWNEVDRLLWQQDDVRGTSIAKPAELDLEAGTYLWRVSAIRDDRQMADSGWSAFVIRE